MTNRRSWFTYEYDFGDSWLHEIQLEKRVEVEPGRKYPACIEGALACPPEDIGGLLGYYELLEALKGDGYNELLEFIGGSFDPDEFDPITATKSMKRGL